MTWSRTLLVLLAWLGIVPFAHATKGWVVILNCSGAKVRLCSYNKTDVVQSVAASEGDVEDGRALLVKCDTDGGCYVGAIKPSDSCYNLSKNPAESLLRTTKLGEKSYRLMRDGAAGTGYKFVWVSDEKHYFDEPAHAYCEATKAQGERCSKIGECFTGHCVSASDDSGKICCYGACNQTCQMCSPDGGQCRSAKYGQSGSGCTGADQYCDGEKQCKRRAVVANGGACKGGLECKSGFCADGVCCDSKCDGTCVSCDQKGKVGACTRVPAGATDDTCSYSTTRCDAAGKCVPYDPPRPCKSDADCPTGKRCQSYGQNVAYCQ